MRAEEIADLCLAETGADRLSKHAREVCYVSMLHANTAGMKPHKAKVRKVFKDSGEYGSVFLIFVLPVLISLVSHWLARWLWSDSRTEVEIRTMKCQAFDALTELSPAMTATLTYTSSPTTSHGKQRKW